MGRLGPALLAISIVACPAFARHEPTLCNTGRETAAEALFLHRQALRRPVPRVAAAPALGNRDFGNIAVIEDSDGVAAFPNQFNLDLNTLTFTPNGAQYAYSVSAAGYDSAAAAAGTPLAALDDDDSRLIALPFAFSFFGAAYNQVWVNSDGNLTFTAGDSASTDRSLSRMTAGPPRISPLFDDLDPALTPGGVRVFSDATRFVVSWVAVPEWVATGLGIKQTFQATLYPDGRIAFSYSGVNATSAVVGIAPGNQKGSTTITDYRTDPTAGYAAAIAERFGNTTMIDTASAAQKFYQTHEDAYDYLVIYNNEGIEVAPSVLANENTVRSSGTGYGLGTVDNGQMYGSPARLHAILNMGKLSDYPADPTALVPARAPQGDTPITALGHETGHLFLAFASIPDPNDPSAKPMLGYQNAHWAFTYNSEASFLEGERITDRGAGVKPEFLTTATVSQYSPLDQYLMGFRPASDVPDTFLVTGTPSDLPLMHPLLNYGFDGTRQNISISDVIQAMGRRTPDYTVAQRRFRFAFLLIVPQGTDPSAADIAKLETFRRNFETLYAGASSNNGIADTSLRRSVALSLAPAAGLAPNASITATLTVATAPAADLVFQLQAPHGFATPPPTARIASGTKNTSFNVTPVKAGVEEITAVPSDAAYETTAARVQVADPSQLSLIAVSGDRQISTSAAPLPDPIVVRLTDVNNLAYPGARITAAASQGGSVTPPFALTDAAGTAPFRWTPGLAPSNQLQLTLDGSPSVRLAVSAGSAVPVISAVVNSASFQPALAPGTLATLTGVNLSGGQVSLAGAPLASSYAGDTQINFYIPDSVTQGSATLTVQTASGSSATTSIQVGAVAPGIFPGAVLHAGTAISAATTPVSAGDYIEIYCTGLGPTRLVNSLQQTVDAPTVFVGAIPVQPAYSGLVPAIAGLYQIDVQVPAGLAPGAQSLILSVSQAHSNQVSIQVQ
jgi:uncharacterized protein (TIGR03437 family)